MKLHNYLYLLVITLIHLKPVQIYWRIWLYFYRPKKLEVRKVTFNTLSAKFLDPVDKRISMDGSLKWNFLNQLACLAEVGWTDSRMSKLWRYNQHYFDDLNAKSALERETWHSAYIQAWIEDNQFGSAPGWDPYPTSLRIVNWIKYNLTKKQLTQNALDSLFIQTFYLSKKIEWHIQGNHLIANAKGLIFAGLFFSGPLAREWQNTGFKIFLEQISEQVLKDGAHFERSPMYHAIITEDLLDILNIAKAYWDKLSDDQHTEIAAFETTATRMIDFLQHVNHPDGQLSFFNDSCFNVAPETNEILSYASRLGLDIYKLAKDPITVGQSGFYSFKFGGNFLIADFGSVGPKYQPGHAHAGTLSFEYSVNKQRVFVNSGTSTYCTNELRKYQRSSKAHNTMMLKKKDSSQVWSAFRVAHRAKVFQENLEVCDEYVHLSGAHDGYKRDFSRGIHFRDIFFSAEKLSIIDKINRNICAETFFYVHPDVVVKQIGEYNGVLCLPDGSELIWSFAGAKRISVSDTYWYPSFGVSIKNQCIQTILDDSWQELTIRHLS
jgi:uncharacterized heparinase superfamily protein